MGYYGNWAVFIIFNKSNAYIISFVALFPSLRHQSHHIGCAKCMWDLKSQSPVSRLQNSRALLYQAFACATSLLIIYALLKTRALPSGGEISTEGVNTILNIYWSLDWENKVKS